MSKKDDNIIMSLRDISYVPISYNDEIGYGGSQMWFSSEHKFSKDYLIHNYGCGTIACSDLFLFLALQYDSHRNPLTEMALHGLDTIYYRDYISYVHIINSKYTKTKRWLAVLGTKLADAVNDYSEDYNLGYYAKWKWRLSYYDMYETILEMLDHNIPVILSIGPNTPNLWGKKGITFYRQYTDEFKPNNAQSNDNIPINPDTKHTEPSAEMETPIIINRYKKAQELVNSHYVTVTGIVKDDYEGRIMLCISSWGEKYYIDYEEYRDYISEYGGTFTSSIVYIK